MLQFSEVNIWFWFETFSFHCRKKCQQKNENYLIEIVELLFTTNCKNIEHSRSSPDSYKKHHIFYPAWSSLSFRLQLLVVIGNNSNLQGRELSNLRRQIIFTSFWKSGRITFPSHNHLPLEPEGFGHFFLKQCIVSDIPWNTMTSREIHPMWYWNMLLSNRQINMFQSKISFRWTCH